MTGLELAIGGQGKVTEEMRRLVLEDVALGISYRQIAPLHDVVG